LAHKAIENKKNAQVKNQTDSQPITLRMHKCNSSLLNYKP